MVVSEFAIGWPEIEAAQGRIRPWIFRTAVTELQGWTGSTTASLAVKCENQQRNFAFKARGACNAVMSLTAEQAQQGVVTHSSGNHAAALAWAAQQRGIAAHIVMPENSAKIKLDAVRRLGVQPVLCGRTNEDRERVASEVAERTGAVFIHPFDHPDVIAGQGTVAVEILAQYPQADTLVVPVGGGGLLAGTLLAVQTLRPEIQVFAAEPELADDAFRSLKSGRIEPVLRTDTVADGLRTSLGQLTFPIIQSLVQDVLCVSEQSICRCVSELALSSRLIAEPSGVVALAAIQEHAELFRDRRVVAVLSGGNLDQMELLPGSLNPAEKKPAQKSADRSE